MAGRIYGSFGQVKVDKTGGSTLVAMINLNKWTASFKTDKADVTCFGDTNKQQVTGLAAIQGTMGGFWDSSDRSLFEIALGSKKVTLELIPDSRETPTPANFQGLAYLDAAIDVPANGAVAVTGDWVAAGNWTASPAFP